MIDAAATKPFGFVRYSGPRSGWSLHPFRSALPVWKMRTLSFKTRMIELASEINAEMPGVCGRARCADALSDQRDLGSRAGKVLILRRGLQGRTSVTCGKARRPTSSGCSRKKGAKRELPRSRTFRQVADDGHTCR